MAHAFLSTKHSQKSLKSFGSMKGAGANVKSSNLNAGGDMYWRGKRGGEKMMGTRKTKARGNTSKMGY